MTWTRVPEHDRRTAVGDDCDLDCWEDCGRRRYAPIGVDLNAIDRFCVHGVEGGRGCWFCESDYQ